MNNQVTIDGQAGTIQANGMVRFGSDDSVNVLFYTKSVLDPVKSREKNRPFHVSMPYVRIQQPGEKDYIDRPVTEFDAAKQRWPHHWARYEKGQEPAPAGTPLECLFPQNPEIAANLHTLAVHTVEQLAGLTAHGQQTVGMGSAMWQKKARDFLAAANGGVGMRKFQVENEKLQGQIEVQANQIAQLQKQIEALLAQSQGINSASVPRPMPTIAQEAAAGIMFEDDSEIMDEAFPHDERPQSLGDAMFIEESGEMPAEQEIPAPRRGWPKGKPRNPRV